MENQYIKGYCVIRATISNYETMSSVYVFSLVFMFNLEPPIPPLFTSIAYMSWTVKYSCDIYSRPFFDSQRI